MSAGLDYRQRDWRGVGVGDRLGTLEQELTFATVALSPGATMDTFQGHYDPAYAQAQGQPGVYVNTMHLLGLVDRLVTTWGGPRSALRRRSLRIGGSLYAGDRAVVTGTVTALEPSTDGSGALVTVAVTVTNGEGASCGECTVAVFLPTAA